jgi:hypothetical protein
MIWFHPLRRVAGIIGLLLLIVLAPAPSLAASTPTGTPHWHIVPSPNPGTSPDALTGVAAVSATDVWAVGWSPQGALIEHWDGKRWQVVPNPARQAADVLNGVATVAANDIWAVGYTAAAALIEHWDGTQWQVVPNPATQGALQGAAAISATNVWAVGGALIEHWNGQQWQVVSNPAPQGFLQGVAAVSATDVWAVGFTSVVGVNSQPLTEHWNGASWQVVPSPKRGPYSSSLTSVTAVAATDVWAVGYYQSNTFSYSGETLIEHWNGTAWRIMPSANLPNAYNYLTGVAAVSAHDIWAVGNAAYLSGSGNPPTLTEQWNGRRWQVVPGANPIFSAALNGVAAVAPREIWAVGDEVNDGLLQEYTFTEVYF